MIESHSYIKHLLAGFYNEKNDLIIVKALI